LAPNEWGQTRLHQIPAKSSLTPLVTYATGSPGNGSSIDGLCGVNSSAPFSVITMPRPWPRLTLQIYRIVKTRGVTQAQAGEVLGIRQPQVSLLMRNRSGNFSVERLMDFLTALGHDVEVRVTPSRKDHGRLSVVVAA